MVSKSVMLKAFETLAGFKPNGNAIRCIGRNKGGFSAYRIITENGDNFTVGFKKNQAIKGIWQKAKTEEINTLPIGKNDPARELGFINITCKERTIYDFARRETTDLTVSEYRNNWRIYDGISHSFKLDSPHRIEIIKKQVEQNTLGGFKIDMFPNQEPKLTWYKTIDLSK